MGPVRQPAEVETRDDKHQGERRPQQKAGLNIAQHKVLLNRRGKQIEDLPINEGAGIDRREESDNRPAVQRATRNDH